MLEKEFKAYTDSLTEWESGAISMALYSSTDPLTVQRRLQTLKSKAKSLGVSEADFDEAQKAEVAKALNKSAKREQSDFDLFIPPSFKEGSKFLHNVMGDYLIKQYHVCKINDALHVYDNGIYKAGEEAVNSKAIELLPDSTRHQRKEVYAYIKANSNTPTKEIAPARFIPFASKIYDIEQDAFLEYSPEYVFLNRFPYDYNKDAEESPLVKETLAKIADNDAEIVELILEAFGSCFLRENRYRGAFILYGERGNNGKSTLLNMGLQMIGEQNASKLQLIDFEERFRIVQLYGKAANFGDDISTEYISNSSNFKKAVTGEWLQGERKGQDVVPFIPHAKLFFAANEMPTFRDKSPALLSRIQLIPLDHDFSADPKSDANMKNRNWTQSEMEYLVKLSVDALFEVIKRNGFIQPEACLRLKKDFEQDNDPVVAFLDEYGEIENKFTSEVYDDYRVWCSRSGHKAVLTRGNFSKAVCTKKHLGTKRVRNPHDGGKLGYMFVPNNGVSRTSGTNFDLI